VAIAEAVGRTNELSASSFTKEAEFEKIAAVKISRNGSETGFARWIVLVSVLVIAALAGWIVWQLRAERMVQKKQDALILGIEKRSPSRIKRLLAEDYEDRWGFDQDDVVEAILDVGSQFMTLVVTEEDRSFVIDESSATVSSRLVISGKPVGPGGNEATRRLNQLEEPFVFTWEKQSFLPASWRLIRLDNAGLPEDLYGYEPGDIRRAMRGE
jgi:hypothetical protein